MSTLLRRSTTIAEQASLFADGTSANTAIGSLTITQRVLREYQNQPEQVRAYAKRKGYKPGWVHHTLERQRAAQAMISRGEVP